MREGEEGVTVLLRSTLVDLDHINVTGSVCVCVCVCVCV